MNYLAGIALLLMPFNSAFAKAKPESELPNKFTEACIHAYETVNTSAPAGLGRKICECTGPETKSQGATDKALKSETANLLKDPKYQFKDKHVLDAMKYCTITTLENEE